MGNPDIRDFINELDQNQENNDHIIDDKEVQLLNNVLSNTEQKEQLQKILDQKWNFEKIIKLIKNGINKQTNIEFLNYYENFISSFESVQKFDDDEMNIIESAKQTIEFQKHKINNELSKKTTNNIEQTNKNISTSLWSVDNTNKNLELRNKLNILWEKDIVDFKNILEWLKKWEVSLEQMDPLNMMTQIIKVMANMEKASVLSEFEKLISDKFPEKKSDPELASFKDILSGLLDNKWLLNQFVETVDYDLKWLSYSQLIEQAKDSKNLESAEAKKSINTIFHMDKTWFDQLLIDFDDPIKKDQVTNILKKYYELHGKTLHDWFVFEKGNTGIMVDNKSSQVECFKILWTDEIIYYGELDTGKSMNFEQVAKISWVSEALAIDNSTQLKQLDPRIWEIMKNTITTPSWKKLSWGDAFTSFFNSPFFDQLKQAFYSLMATFWEESEQERYIIESNYVVAKNDVRQWWNFTYRDNQNKEQTISYISVLNKFEPGFDKNENINYKKLFTEASITIQKSYIETCMSKGKEAWYNILKSNIPLIEASKIEKEKNSWAKEFISWSVIDELKINKDAKGKVEKKWEWDNQYLLIDGQVIPLIDGKGSLFVQSTDGGIVEKNIIIDKKDNKENITISDWEKLQDTNLKSNDLTSQDGKMFRLWKYLNIDQWSNAQKITKMIVNLPQWEGKNKIETSILLMKNKINALSSWNRTKEKINFIIEDTKKAISLYSESFQNKDDINTIIKSRSQDIWRS